MGVENPFLAAWSAARCGRGRVSPPQGLLEGSDSSIVVIGEPRCKGSVCAVDILPEGRGTARTPGVTDPVLRFFPAVEILDVALSCTELVSSVGWSRQLADGVPRGVWALSRAGSAEAAVFH